MTVAAGLRPGVTESVGLAGRQLVASYTTYGQAQRAVDYLSDSSFPVEHTAIVGRDQSVTVGDAYAERARQLLSSLG